MSILGSNDIGNGLEAVNVDHDPSAVPTDVPAGSLIIDANGQWWRKIDDGATTNVFMVAGVEDSDFIFTPEGSTTGNGTRGAQDTFEGASYYIRRPSEFNRFLFRLSGASAGASLRVLIYQDPQGRSMDPVTKTVPLVLAMTAIPAAGGGENIVVSPALTRLQQGVVYLLYGREDATSATFQTYTTQQLARLTTNVDLETHPTSFTTTILSTTSPATVDPRTAPTGAFTPGGSTNRILIARGSKA